MSFVPHYCSRCGQEGYHLRCPKRRKGIDLASLPELIPIPMILFCPVCQLQHIDAPNPKIGWTDPPHKSHECQGCKVVWRPCDLATTGVKAIATRGKADTWQPDPEKMHRWQTDQDQTNCLDCGKRFNPMQNQSQLCTKRMPASKMYVPSVPVCWCGAPSTRESGWCGRPECDSVKSLESLKSKCVCPFGTLLGDCPEHGFLVPP